MKAKNKRLIEGLKLENTRLAAEVATLKVDNAILPYYFCYNKTAGAGFLLISQKFLQSYADLDTEVLGEILYEDWGYSLCYLPEMELEFMGVNGKSPYKFISYTGEESQQKAIEVLMKLSPKTAGQLNITY